MNNKLETISNFFDGKEIRSIWNEEKEEQMEQYRRIWKYIK